MLPLARDVRHGQQSLRVDTMDVPFLIGRQCVHLRDGRAHGIRNAGKHGFGFGDPGSASAAIAVRSTLLTGLCRYQTPGSGGGCGRGRSRGSWPAGRRSRGGSCGGCRSPGQPIQPGLALGLLLLLLLLLRPVAAASCSICAASSGVRVFLLLEFFGQFRVGRELSRRLHVRGRSGALLFYGADHLADRAEHELGRFGDLHPVVARHALDNDSRSIVNGLLRRLGSVHRNLCSAAEIHLAVAAAGRRRRWLAPAGPASLVRGRHVGNRGRAALVKRHGPGCGTGSFVVGLFFLDLFQDFSLLFQERFSLGGIQRIQDRVVNVRGGRCCCFHGRRQGWWMEFLLRV
mmetsp:Transcript_19543/g.54537  ORF Transcript_19543/g.54537 Transcript_19543/m.54537 type:complete len:345 (+) Transcript_19543:290-1324(+)